MTNDLLFGMKKKMAVEEAKLMAAPKTSINLDLIKAANVLNQKSYERYKIFQQRGLHDLQLGTHYDTASEEYNVCV